MFHFHKNISTSQYEPCVQVSHIFNLSRIQGELNCTIMSLKENGLQLDVYHLVSLYFIL